MTTQGDIPHDAMSLLGLPAWLLAMSTPYVNPMVSLDKPLEVYSITLKASLISSVYGLSHTSTLCAREYISFRS